MAPRPVDVTIRGKDQSGPAFDSASKNAETFGTRVKEAVSKPFELIKGLVAIEAVRWFGDLAKASVESAASADAAWGRVESAVTNVGISFSGTKNQLDALFTKIQQTTRYSDDDAASAFATLVTISGNYAGSIKNLTLATDLAANKQIGLNEAAELVGKVMAGTGAKALKQFGIDIKDGANAVDELRAKLNGFAERDAGTLEGRLHQVANGWDNVKEAIGRALSGDDGNSGLSGFAEKLNDVGKWIDDHKAQRLEFIDWLSQIEAGLKRVGTLLTDKRGVLGFTLNQLLSRSAIDDAVDAGQSSLMRHMGISDDVSRLAQNRSLKGQRQGEDPLAERAEIATEAQIAANTATAAAAQKKRDREAEAKAQKEADDAQRKHIEGLKEEVDWIEQRGKLVGKTAKDYDRIAQIVGELTRLAKSDAGSSQNRAAAADFIVKRNDDLKRLYAESDKAFRDIGGADLLGPKGVHTIGENRIDDRASASALPVIVGGSRGIGAQIGDRIKEQMGGEDAFRDVDTSLGKLQDHMKDFGANTITGFFGEWQQGINDVIQGHEKMAVVIPRVLRRAIGASLAADAQDTMLRAAKALALGLTDPSGIHFAQAGRLFAIGTAELAAAAALSGGGGSGGGGGGGSLSAGGFSQVQNDMSNRGKVSVILKGKMLDFHDPDSLNALADALRELGETRELEFILDGSQN